MLRRHRRVIAALAVVALLLDGTVIGREGDIVEGYGGGVGDDDVFHVCVIGG